MQTHGIFKLHHATVDWVLLRHGSCLRQERERGDKKRKQVANTNRESRHTAIDTTEREGNSTRHETTSNDFIDKTWTWFSYNDYKEFLGLSKGEPSTRTVRKPSTRTVNVNLNCSLEFDNWQTVHHGWKLTRITCI